MKLTLKLILAACLAVILASTANWSFEASYASVLGLGVLTGFAPIKGALNSFIVPNIGELSLKMPRRLTRFGFACYKTDAPEETEEQKKSKQKLLGEIKDMIEEGVKTRMKKEDVETFVTNQMKQFEGLPENFLRGLADPKTGVLEVIKKQGQEIEELKTRTGASGDSPKTLKQQVTEWHTRNKASIDRILIDKTKAELTPLNIRAVASPMTPATVNTGGSVYIPRPFIETGVTDIPRLQPTFWDSLRKGRTGSPVYVWVNKTNPQGAAAFIGPGVSKPGVSFELATEISNAKKIAVSSKAATELLADIDGMVDMIEGEMRFKLFDKLNSTLMTGTLSATVPAGIQTLSVGYTLSTVLTTNPNYFDAIRALVAQLTSGVLAGRVVVYVNPIDLANMELTKATDSGVYLLPPFANQNGTSVGGAQVIADKNIAVGHVQAALIDYYVIKIYEDFNVSQGWENDDFTRNLVTWVAEMRLHQIFNSAYTGAFIYDTFSNIIDAITPAP